MKDKTARVLSIAAMAALACLALSGCDTSDLDQDSTNKLGIALGVTVIIISWLGMRFSGRYFGRKRQANKRKNNKKRKR